jgi:hypothetical protein
MKEDPAAARAADDQQSTMGAKLVDMAVQLEHAQVINITTRIVHPETTIVRVKNLDPKPFLCPG